MDSSDSNEISFTVEETNKMRIALGLKPLNMEKPNKEKEAVENFRNRSDADKR